MFLCAGALHFCYFLVNLSKVDARGYVQEEVAIALIAADPKNVARLADYCRACFIYERGGCICDCDTIWLQHWWKKVALYFGHAATVAESNRSIRGLSTDKMKKRMQTNFYNVPGENLSLTFPACFPPKSPVLADYIEWARPQILSSALSSDPRDFMHKMASLLMSWGLAPAISGKPWHANAFPYWSRMKCIQKGSADSEFDANCPKFATILEEAMCLNCYWQSNGHLGRDYVGSAGMKWVSFAW